VKDDADACEWRKAERPRKAKGMKKRKNAQNPIAIMEMEDLLELFDIRSQIEMRKHDALRLARGTAGENDGRRVIQRRRPRNAQEEFEKL